MKLKLLARSWYLHCFPPVQSLKLCSESTQVCGKKWEPPLYWWCALFRLLLALPTNGTKSIVSKCKQEKIQPDQWFTAVQASFGIPFPCAAAKMCIKLRFSAKNACDAISVSVGSFLASTGVFPHDDSVVENTMLSLINKNTPYSQADVFYSKSSRTPWRPRRHWQTPACFVKKKNPALAKNSSN